MARGLSLTDEQAETAFRQSRGNETQAMNALQALAARISSAHAYAPPTREARIHKACTSLAPHSDAVDILIHSLTKLQADPQNERFRKVNVQFGPFKDRVASKPGGTELLYALGFEPMHGYLVLQTFDAPLLSQALAALEKAKATPAYVDAKSSARQSLASKQAEARDAAAIASKKAVLLAKVPAEPKPGEDGMTVHSCCMISIHLAGAEKLPPLAKRRFESDNVLNDLVRFVRSLPTVPLESPLTIENVTTSPPVAFDLEKQRDSSLYSCDLWPVARIRVAVTAS